LGRFVAGTIDPPPVKERPWFNLTLVIPITEMESSATQTQIQTSIGSIMAVDNVAKIDYRLVRIDVWGKTDGTAIKVVGFDTDGSDVLFDRTDYGSFARRASIHYIYGDKQNQDVLPNTLAAPGYTIYEVSNGSFVYLHVLFRVRVAAPSTRQVFSVEQLRMINALIRANRATMDEQNITN
jgi:hypothetical protein